MLGLSAAFGGTWVERNGPRKAMFVAACCWGTGFMVAALGVATDQLWVVYLGYGVIGGIGLGIGYISPVSTLIKWFPDRPGMATGLAIMGFGGGALIAAPLSNKLLDTFADQPADAIAPAFVTLGIIYFVVMTLGRVHRPAPRPRAGSRRAGRPTAQTARRMITTRERHRRQRDPDAAVLAAVGRAVLQRDGRHRHPRAGLADDPGPLRHGQRGRGRRLRRPALALQHERALRVVVDVGPDRAQDDVHGATSGIGAVLYFLLASTGTASVAWFVLLTGVILSFYGGGFATVPAYLKDLFGTIQVGAIHGRLLTAWSVAGVAGPLIVNAIADQQTAAGKSGADLYTLSLYIMVGVLAVGFIANLLIRPVDERFHETDRPPGTVRATRRRRRDADDRRGARPWTDSPYAQSCCGSWWRVRSPTA